MADAGMAPARIPGAVYRINELPDDILLRFLSHLGARQVVQTSVLSRRWRGLWRSVPRINATRHEFDGMDEDEDEEEDEEEDEWNLRFRAFINRFLLLRNPVRLDELRITYSLLETSSRDLDEESEDANLWIRHALQSDARSITVCSFSPYEFYPEAAVFASKCFLKSLELHFALLPPGFFGSLQMGCTVLERLILHTCTISDPNLSSQTLKSVTIVDAYDTSDEEPSISIPCLLDLHLKNSLYRPKLENLKSLVTASVDVNDIRSLSGVSVLRFCGSSRKGADYLQWCPKFNRLMVLTLDASCLGESFYTLVAFLQNSPNLVGLTLKFTNEYRLENVQFLRELEGISFACEDLRTVRLEGLKDNLLLSTLKKLFVGNGITSEQIVIVD